MINEKFYDEIKEQLIKGINDTFTLNLAISLWKDSKKYKVDSEYYKQALNEISDLISKEKWDWKMVEHILQIIDKVLGDDK